MPTPKEKTFCSRKKTSQIQPRSSHSKKIITFTLLDEVLKNHGAMCVPWFNTIPPPFPHHPHQPARKNLHGSISAEGCQPFCTAPVTLINSSTEWGPKKNSYFRGH